MRGRRREREQGLFGGRSIINVHDSVSSLLVTAKLLANQITPCTCIP